MVFTIWVACMAWAQSNLSQTNPSSMNHGKAESMLSVAHSVGGVEDEIGAAFDSNLKVFLQLTISGCLTTSAGSQSVSTDCSEANSSQKLN